MATKKKSWTSFDRAAKRALGAFKVGDVAEAAAELKDNDLSMPEDLLRLAASIDDGARIDLKKLGGSATQELFSVSGLIDANHREEGGFGSRIASGELPAGLIMFGYGATQLIYDTNGELGAAGSIWSCQDEDVTDAKKLADSLEALLAGATAPVIEDEEPPPPPKVKLMPTPAPFAAPRDGSALFTKGASAPVTHFVTARANDLWFRGGAKELFAFDLGTERWTALTSLPDGFEMPDALVLSDGSVMLFTWDYPTKKHRSVRGDGRGEWRETAALPPEAATSGAGRGVLPDGRVLVAGGRPGDERSAWLYDPKLDVWSPGPKLPEAASFSAVMQATNGPHFLSVTGERFLPRVFSFDEHWHVARSPESASKFTTVALADGRFALVLIEQRDAACLVYDPVARTTSALPAVPMTDSTAAACALSEKVICSVRQQFLATLELSKDAWTAGPSLPSGFTVFHLAQRGDRTFAFCREVVPGEDFPKAEVTVFSASTQELA